MDDYDLLAIGSGSASFAAAIRATEHGARAALIERGTVGGTCVNVGCIPSRHLPAASHAYRAAGHDVLLAGVYAVRFGLTINDLASTWVPYLTMSEGLKLAAQAYTRDVAKLSCCAA